MAVLIQVNTERKQEVDRHNRDSLPQDQVGNSNELTPSAALR